MPVEETPGAVLGFKTPPANYNKEAIQVAVKEKIRIRIKGYEDVYKRQSQIWASVSTEHGPAISARLPSPIFCPVGRVLSLIHI